MLGKSQTDLVSQLKKCNKIDQESVYVSTSPNDGIAWKATDKQISGYVKFKSSSLVTVLIGFVTHKTTTNLGSILREYGKPDKASIGFYQYERCTFTLTAYYFSKGFDVQTQQTFPSCNDFKPFSNSSMITSYEVFSVKTAEEYFREIFHVEEVNMQSNLDLLDDIDRWYESR